jgi:hypothetical protein
MSLVAELITELKLKSGEFQKGLAEAAAQASTFSKVTSMAMVGVGAAVGLATASMGILGHAILEQTEKIDQLGKMAKRLGLDFESFQSLSFAAYKADVSIGAVENSLVKLTRSLVDATEEGDRAGVTLRRIGIDAEEFKALNFDQQILKLADAYKRIPEGQAQVQLNNVLFGRSGSAVLSLLQSDIKAAKKEYEEMGVVLSKLDLKNVEALDDAWKNFKTVGAGFMDHLTADLAQPFADLIKGITGGFGDVRSSAASMATGILTYIKFVIQEFNALVNIINNVVSSIERIGSTITTAIKSKLDLLKDQDKSWSETLGLDDVMNRFALVGRAISAGTLEPSVIGTKEEGGGVQGFVDAFKSSIPSLIEGAKTVVNGIIGDVSSPATKAIDGHIAAIQKQQAEIAAGSKKAADGLGGAGDAAQNFGSKLTNTIDAFFKSQGQGGINRILSKGPDGVPLKQAQDNRFDELITRIANQQVKGVDADRALQEARNIAGWYDRNPSSTAVQQGNTITFAKDSTASEMLQVVKDTEKFLQEHKQTFTPSFLLTIEGPTDLFYYKVSENSFTDKKIGNSVQQYFQDAGAAVSA